MTNFETIVDRIYEASADAALWPQVMDELSSNVAAAGGIIITQRSDAWIGWRYSSGLAHGAEDYLSSRAALESQATIRLIGANRAGFVDALDVFTEQEWLNDPMMTQWGSPAGLTRAAATAIPTPSGDLVVVQVSRRADAPRFSRDEIANLDAFRPHLARAGLLAARWRLERLRAATEALAALGLPAVVIDAKGKAIVANSLADELPTYLSWLPKDRFALTDPSANALLFKTISLVGNRTAAVGRSIPAKGTDNTSVVVHLIPTTRIVRDLLDGGHVLLVFSRVTTPSAPDLGVIRGLFDLTAAEARVAASLTEGFSPTDIALQSGVSVETVRSQIKSMLDKTGLNRQAQLVALLAAHGALPRA